MAKNREPQKAVDSQSESGEEEESGEELEEASSEEVNSQESESEPEFEQRQVPKKVSTPATQKQNKVSNKAAPVTQAHSSSEESGSESESDSDRPGVTSPQQKSINGPVKPRSGVQASTSTVVKRPAEEKESERRDAKKAKKKPESPVKNSKDDPKKSLFQRLWSEDDEIALLNGMIEYSSKKKSDPVADLNAFLAFIKENLHVDVTRTQLQDKIRRLRKKYENNKSKEKDGKGRTFAKSHEQKAYELSKLVWGTDVGKDHGGENGVGSPRANGSAVRKASSKKAADNEEAKDSRSGVVVSGKSEKVSAGKGFSPIGLSLEERILRAGDELFGGEGAEGEEWRKLKVEEIELYAKQVELKLAQSRLVLSALKSQDF